MYLLNPYRIDQLRKRAGEPVYKSHTHPIQLCEKIYLITNIIIVIIENRSPWISDHIPPYFNKYNIQCIWRYRNN